MSEDAKKRLENIKKSLERDIIHNQELIKDLESEIEKLEKEIQAYRDLKEYMENYQSEINNAVIDVLSSIYTFPHVYISKTATLKSKELEKTKDDMQSIIVDLGKYIEIVQKELEKKINMKARKVASLGGLNTNLRQKQDALERVKKQLF